jgi:hypothetical protein
MKSRILLAVASAALLGACGDMVPDTEKLLDPATLAEQLPPEAQGVVTSYAGDLRGAAEAYKAEFGQLPASFAEVPSLADARAAAVNLIADGLGEQVPFASRETLEQAANGIVTAAEGRILDQMRTENAGNP